MLGKFVFVVVVLLFTVQFSQGKNVNVSKMLKEKQDFEQYLQSSGLNKEAFVFKFIFSGNIRKIFSSNLFLRNVCCKIDPPAIPIFTSDGHLQFYIPGTCPEQYKVCCKNYINIHGICVRKYF